MDQRYKIKEGIFVGPQIKDLVNDRNCDEVLEETEKTAREALKLVVDNFLGNHKAPNYRQSVQQSA
jgi:hypothetical protein